MRFCTVPAVLSALVLVFVPGCATGTDGDGDDGVDGPYPADSLEEARAIAAPLAEDWDAGDFCYEVKGFVLDSDGILLGPELLSGDSDRWELRFNAGGDAVFHVRVFYDGTCESHEDTLYPEVELPDYSNEHVKSLMNLADDAFQENVGEADYLYRLDMGTADVNIAMVEGFYPTVDDLAGFVFMDADTFEIIDTSW
jgi:hypothetical protein